MADKCIRVVITGMGVVSPLGKTITEMWEALLRGESGVDHITLFDASLLGSRIAAEIKDWDPTVYVDRKEARRMDRFTQFAVAASLMAMRDAGLENTDSYMEKTGVIIGNCIGGITTLSEQFRVLNEKGADRISPFLAPMMSCDSGPGQVSIILGVKGPNFCASSACSSGSDAIGEATEVIRRGDAVAMIAGGAEAAVTPISLAAFNSAKALSTRNDDPQKASRPFDAERDGFVIGEGAAIVILEELEHAIGRGANIIAELVGYGATADAFHITQPAEGGEGAVRAILRALEDGRLKPADIDYINAHGTSTQLNDKIETHILKTIFKQQAYKIPVSSTKSMLGHLLGAAGAIEAIICALAIKNSIIPPTINLTHQDPECDLDYVPDKPRQAEVNTALSNSFGFGGHNSVLILRRYTGQV